MYFFYNIFVILIGWLLKPISLFNKKISLFLDGRKNTFKQLEAIKKTDNVIWFHCASLGEFEQGRPVIEAIKENNNFKIVLTFFSPSGYEIRKNYEFADVICYLPLDTKENAKQFLDKINPEIAIFVKYEFWPNILNELKERAIKTLLISAIFRKEQVFFKPNGIAKKFMQNSLKTFNHFFVQDKNSEKLLKSIGFNNVTVSGDSRFDSVYKIANQDNSLDFIENFIKNNTNFVLIAGSTWKKDEELLVNYINNHSSTNQQFIIAPHTINDDEIERLKTSIHKETLLFSEIGAKNNNAQVLIVNTIGLLTKIYSYATIAYVGGGFGAGIHNILEPATFGIPILIGPKFHKFKEAKDLVLKKGCIVINNKEELKQSLNTFTNKTLLEQTGAITSQYVNNNVGATLHIINYVNKIIPNFTH